MRRSHFYVALPPEMSVLAEFNPDAELSEYDCSRRELCIEAIPQQDRVTRAWMEFRQDRMGRPGAFILGWQTWLQLGWETSCGLRNGPLMLTEYRGLPIVVREDIKDYCLVCAAPGRGVKLDTQDDR